MARIQKGFTIIELIVVVAILAVILPAILQSFISSSLLNETSRNAAVAMTHAQYVMEEIKNTDFASIASKVNNGDWDWDRQDIENAGLTALADEAIDAQAGGTDLLTIAITVNWEDRPGRVRNTQLVTYIAQP
jgi:prepilin-type N-terminal cleavage/methylation domain-containing protein